MNKQKQRKYIGFFAFNTEEGLEQAYIDDFERKLTKQIIKFLEEHNFTFDKKKIHVVIAKGN